MGQKMNCDCETCKNNKNFKVPKELINDFLYGKVAIFAGSGISTESKNVLKFTFYEEIASEIDQIDSSLTFPDLMEEYCKLPNGRLMLFEKIRSRFRNISSFPQLEGAATRFHREIATLYPIQNIVTTNWDTYFEEYCDASPFVADGDLAFWNNSERKVLKIHGSINNYGSIIATKSDYEKCSKSLDKGIIGSILKTILATQTVVFIGYSLSDFDFINIYNFVLKQMKGLHKQAYIVTPFGNNPEKYKKLGLIPIITDGTYFISQIKKHAIHEKIIQSDELYDNAAALLSIVFKEHEKMCKEISFSENPQLIYTACYQDGMIHALERALQCRNSGEYSHSCRVRSVVDSYFKIQKEKLKKKKYDDVAYIEGYINALIFIQLENDENESFLPPLYFAFGIKEDLMNYERFLEILPDLPKKHKTAYKLADKKIKSLKNKDGIEFHHPPWL